MQWPMRSGRSSCRLPATSEQPAGHLAVGCRRPDFLTAFSGQVPGTGPAGAAGGLLSTGKWPAVYFAKA